MTTGMNLSSLHLHMDFDNGSSADFGPSYFTLASDLLSWNGSPIPIGGTNPLPTSAVLTGLFSPTVINVSGMGTQTIASGFTATILPSSGPTLNDGDLAVIYATTTVTGGVPEPSTWVLMTGAFAAAGVWKRRALRSRIPVWPSKSAGRTILLIGVLALTQRKRPARARP